jgi:hypothetical protein
MDLTDAAWRKSSRSTACGNNCVEVAFLDDGVAVRDSKTPDGPALRFTQAEWAAFVEGAKDGEFDQAGDEPANDERVAVDMLDDIRLYRRDDSYAQAEDQPERNWRLVSRLGDDEDGSDLTWRELTELGGIAYVGQFVDRRVKAEA